MEQNFYECSNTSVSLIMKKVSQEVVLVSSVNFTHNTFCRFSTGKRFSSSDGRTSKKRLLTGPISLINKNFCTFANVLP